MSDTEHSNVPMTFRNTESMERVHKPDAFGLVEPQSAALGPVALVPAALGPAALLLAALVLAALGPAALALGVARSLFSAQARQLLR